MAGGTKTAKGKSGSNKKKTNAPRKGSNAAKASALRKSANSASRKGNTIAAMRQRAQASGLAKKAAKKKAAKKK